jgi:hypothetical protein
MSQEKVTRAVVEIEDFPGLVTSADANDVRGGAAIEQINVECSKAGALRVRPGIRELRFED